MSQQVLALHPKLRELRTASLLTTFQNKYHVQYHNPELGVHIQSDTTLIPIGPSENHRQIESRAQTPEKSPESKLEVNRTRNQMLMAQQLPGNRNFLQTLLNQAENGIRQKSILPVTETEYTLENKKAMALLLMLIER